MQEEIFNKQDSNLDQPIVNESLALAGLFRKVSTKERLPKQVSVYYNTDLGKTWFIGFDDVIWKRDITWWLEEVKLPSDDITNIHVTNLLNKFVEDDDFFDFGFRCAKWMRDFVLAGKAVTAKDNVR